MVCWKITCLDLFSSMLYSNKGISHASMFAYRRVFQLILRFYGDIVWDDVTSRELRSGDGLSVRLTIRICNDG